MTFSRAVASDAEVKLAIISKLLPSKSSKAIVKKIFISNKNCVNKILKCHFKVEHNSRTSDLSVKGCVTSSTNGGSVPMHRTTTDQQPFFLILLVVKVYGALF